MDGEGEGEGEGLNPDSHVLPKLKQRGSRVDGGVDRISQLPNEILFLILSSLPVRNAAATTVLSSRWLDLWKQNPNLKFNLHSDRISQLPDQIILAILSLLTVRESVATSVLSSRWSDLWMLCPYLNFYGGDFDNDVNLCEVVNSVIQSHKAPSLKQFSVSFSVLESDKSAVTKWLEFVSSRPVEVLELDFTFTLYSVMVVLEESLREMSSPFLCQSLKRLSLKFLIVSGEDIELFLCNCPLLEELTIYKAPLTSDINVCGAKLMLKRLDLLGCEGAISLQVSAPNLTSFRFPHTVGKLVFENVPELVEADLVCLSPEFPVLHITCISQLQILKLNFSHFKLLYTDVLSRMPNLKKLFIHCVTVNNCSLPRLTDLIWASPHLEEFTFKVLDVIVDPSAMVEDISNVERSPHQHLKVFNFKMFSDPTDLVGLAMYFSDNCVALRRIGINYLDAYRPDRDYIRQRLRGKLRSQIQMRFNVLM